jgi:hypothetical protein
VRRASWAIPVGIVVCVFGLALNLRALGRFGFGNGSGMLGTSYALWMAAILIMLIASRPKPRGRRQTAAVAAVPAAVVAPAADAAISSTIPDGDGWRAALLASLQATGVERPRRHWARYALGMVILVGIGTSSTLFARHGFRGEPARVQYAILGLWYAGGMFVVTPFLAAGRRALIAMRAKSASDELASAGARRPILYLRSFEIDEDTSRPSILEFFGILLATSTPEQKLAQQLSRVGPVIAIGRPGEALPPLGAARFYAPQGRHLVRGHGRAIAATGIPHGDRGAESRAQAASRQRPDHRDGVERAASDHAVGSRRDERQVDSGWSGDRRRIRLA